MQQYCTRCGSPRSAPAAPCVTCGTRPPDPPGPGELTRADGSIPVYVEPDPTTWDYEPLGPDGGVPGATGGGPPPWGYYDEPQQLPAAGGFWGTFPGSPGAPPRARQRRAVRARPASRGPRRRSRWQRAPWRGPGGRLPATLVAAAVLLLVAFGGGAYAAITAFTGHPGKPGQAGPSAL
ncbi:MAG TPA: hypothetical protein VH478_22050, partial [Trebonia sp.]|nr:hypothetical protein [Trebonia sp.]